MGLRRRIAPDCSTAASVRALAALTDLPYHLPPMRLPLLLAFLLPDSASAQEPGYFRYPDLSGDSVVFTAEGDLWTAPYDGGAARRLTSAPGTERFAHFSPDGTQIAFTGEYDGNAEVYVISASGSPPRRLTVHPAGDEVMGWTPTGRVIFRSNRAEPHRRTELFTVAPTGGEPAVLPLGWATNLDIDEVTGAWAFVRTAWEHRTWKRYRGGTAQDIWVGDPNKADFKKATEFRGTDAFPMWHAGRIHFLSDQGGTMNLWSMAKDGSDRQRLTDFGTWDARFANMAPDGRVVMMLAGEIVAWDPGTRLSHRLDIRLPSDRERARVHFPNPTDFFSWASISPEGDRVLYLSRGDVWSLPVEKGPALALTRTPGARESWATWSHDGQRAYWVTDQGGEESIVSADAWGRGESKTIQPAGERGWHFPPEASRDGNAVAWSDDDQRLWIAPIKGGAPRVVDRSDQAEISQYAWSPDSRYLAYVKTDRQDFRSIRIHDTKEGGNHRATGRFTDDHSPAWDPDGRWLWFIGERTVNPTLGGRDFEYTTPITGKPMGLLLRSDAGNPVLHDAGLPPKPGDEKADKKDEKAKKDEKKGAKGDKKTEEKEEPAKPITIQWAGLEERTFTLPVAPGLYGGTEATADAVYWMAWPLIGLAEEGEDEAPRGAVQMWNIEDEEEKTFATATSAFELSAKGGKIMLLRQRGSLAVVDAASPPDAATLEKKAVDSSGVVLQVDAPSEWRQIFVEGWRHMRDFHWDQGMRGIDWPAIRRQYEALLPRVATRDDLRDLMGELIGELATSHTYLWGGGDFGPGMTPVSIGLLGADLVLDRNAWRVVRIYRGDQADAERSPLTLPGSEVKEGEFILEIAGRPARADEPYTASLQGLADKPVTLLVNSKPVIEGARLVVVTPTASETAIRYVDWVRGRREYVAARTGGKVGYVHIPDMGGNGLVRFDTWFYPQLDKEAMVVDARWNGGGFVSQLIIERLRRTLTSFDRSRGGGVWTYPARVLNGPFVVLTNEHAGSDGDIFPQTIKALKLAPVIGTRSWGGVVGIRGDKKLIDGAVLTQPEYAFFWPGDQRGWIVENEGVTPDIVVDNLPQEVARGVDAQLDRGIAEVLKLRDQHPPVKAEFPVEPEKGRKAFEGESGR